MVGHVLRTNFWKYEKGEFSRTVLAPLIGGGIFGADGQVEFAASFDRMNESLMRRFSLPFWRMNEWWTGMDKQIKEDTAVVNDFAYNLIRKRRQKSERQPKSEVAKADEVKDVESILHDLDVKTDKTPTTPETPQMNQSKTIEDNEKETDLMQLFMDAIDDNGEPLPDEALKDILLNFILAGRDTTAQALSWMFYLILRSNSRKDILEKLIAEIDASLDDKNSSQDGTARPTYDSIKTQKYAEACFYETLRLYPSVPHNIRLCAEDDILPGGIPVYKGELVAWGIWAMGRDTAIWGSDAHEYRPERWLQGEKFSSAKFVSFHLGPRTCLGQQFATVEAIMITSMILRDFTLELIDPDTEPNYRSAITLPMADGLPVRIKPRCRTAAL
ncbi:hypothetical protein BGZ49_007852 [Haplosporangium sp. Z 27]|nr:hypothetical protein BGZ49_007852 [Haplosporangium sp. Z 27]